MVETETYEYHVLLMGFVRHLHGDTEGERGTVHTD